MNGATGEGGVIVQAVVIHQVAEGEAVAEQHGIEIRSLTGGSVFGVQRGQPFDVCVGVRSITYGVGRVSLAQGHSQRLHQLPGVAQGQPHVLVHLISIPVVMVFLVVLVLFLFVVVFFFVVVVVVMFHAFDYILHPDILAHGLHEVDDHPVRVHGFGQRAFDPLVALVAHIHEGVADSDLHDVLGGGLVAVQVHAAVQHHGELDIVAVADDLPHPIVDREDGGYDAELLGLGNGSAREHNREQHDKGSNARNKLFHGTSSDYSIVLFNQNS